MISHDTTFTVNRMFARFRCLTSVKKVGYICLMFGMCILIVSTVIAVY